MRNCSPLDDPLAVLLTSTLRNHDRQRTANSSGTVRLAGAPVAPIGAGYSVSGSASIAAIIFAFNSSSVGLANLELRSSARTVLYGGQVTAVPTVPP